MKTTLHVFFYSLILSVSALAQPTITAVGINPVVGDQFINIGSPYISPGSSGANQTWNFSAMTTSSTSTVNVVTVSSTTYGASFPNANIATTSNSTNFEYFKASATDYQSYGSGSASNVDSYSDPEDRLRFPFTYSNNYTDIFNSVYMNGATTVYRNGSTNVTADGYGTLTTPSGTFNNVLRVHLTMAFHDSSTGPSVTVFQKDQYLWYLDGNHSALASVSTITITPAGGSTITNQGSGYLSTTSVGIKSGHSVENAFSLFPNPATQNVQLNFSLEEDKEVKIDFFNALGEKIVSTTEKGVQGNNKYMMDVSTLPEGIYFVQIHLNGSVGYTRKFVVSK